MQRAPHDRLERVYRDQRLRLWRSLLLYTADPEVASDAVAEAFAQALARGEAVRSPEAWVWTAAFRIAAGVMKDRRRMVPVAEIPEVAVPAPTADVLDALGVLSSKQRASVVLHYYAGFSLREVAAMIGSTRGAVGVHLSRARSKLRSMLEVDDG